MLKDAIINKAFSVADFPIKTEISRCVRMRFNKNTCPICMQNCKAAALSVDGGVAINTGKCTLCMICVSECPSECFAVTGMDFFSLLGRLIKTQNAVPYPVLGCKKVGNVQAHEKTVCMGFLSEEHLIALTLFLEKPLQINLTVCAGCENSFIVETIKGRIQRAKEKTALNVQNKVVLVENKADLVFDEVSYDRRGFLKTLKNTAFMRISGLFDENNVEMVKSYSAKKIPLKRDLLNTVLKKLPEGKAVTSILENYAFSVKAGASCTNCFACIGMCPTGALKIKKDKEGAGLLFNSSLCNGCALCRDFCPVGAVSVSQGFSGRGYFKYDLCNLDSYAYVFHSSAEKTPVGIEEAAYQRR